MPCGAGYVAIPAAATLTGLAPGTTYHWRLVAANATGTARSADQQLATLDVAPARVVATSVAAGSPTTLVVAATVDPGGLETALRLEWQTATGAVASRALPALAAADAPVALGATIADLVPDTAYRVRLVATNARGGETGADAAGRTSPLPPPTVVPRAATGIARTGATLPFALASNGLPTTWRVEYGTTGYDQATAPVAAGSGASEPSATLAGLAPGTAYRWRVVATSSSGTTVAEGATFTTEALPRPAISGLATSATGLAGTTVGATIDPAETTTTWHVELGRTTDYGTLDGARDAARGGRGARRGRPHRPRARHAVPRAGGRRERRRHHREPRPRRHDAGSPGADRDRHRARGEHRHGRAPDGPRRLADRRRGLARGRRDDGLRHGHGAGRGRRPRGAQLGGLLPGTAYHARLVARNASGTAAGPDIAFATPATAPTALAAAASAIGADAATIDLRATTGGAATTAVVEWGTTTGYGATSAALVLPAAPLAATGSIRLVGLAPETVYHARVVLESAAGTARSVDVALRTLPRAPGAVSGAGSADAQTAIAVAGTVAPNGAATTWWIEYGTDAALGAHRARDAARGRRGDRRQRAPRWPRGGDGDPLAARRGLGGRHDHGRDAGDEHAAVARARARRRRHRRDHDHDRARLAARRREPARHLGQRRARHGRELRAARDAAPRAGRGDRDDARVRRRGPAPGTAYRLARHRRRTRPARRARAAPR